MSDELIPTGDDMSDDDAFREFTDALRNWMSDTVRLARAYKRLVDRQRTPPLPMPGMHGPLLAIANRTLAPELFLKYGPDQVKFPILKTLNIDAQVKFASGCPVKVAEKPLNGDEKFRDFREVSPDEMTIDQIRLVVCREQKRFRTPEEQAAILAKREREKLSPAAEPGERSFVIEMEVSSATYAVASRRAKKAKMSVSDYLRHRLMESGAL